MTAGLLLVALMALVVIGSRGNEPTATPTPSPVIVDRVPNFAHIYVIVLENESSSSIIGSTKAPYLNQLAHSYGLAANYDAVAHPSQPNYIALWSGSTQGVKDDRVHRIDAQNIGDQLEAAGKSWRVFAQNVPVGSQGSAPTCYTGATSSGGPDGKGTYARKHNPAVSFVDVSNATARCAAHVSNFSNFDPAAANLELIVPNLCNDMHDCGVAAGDAWLKNWLPQHILSTPTWQKTNSAIFVTWDEGSGGASGGGQVATIVISKQTPAGFVSNVPHTHYSLLRTIQDAWGLDCLKYSCTANTLGEFFK